MVKQKRDLHGTKSVIRTLEGLLEVALLVCMYFIFWRNGYGLGIFPAYFGMGKYVLCGVYALLIVVLFVNFDGFKFGYLKTTDEIISQWLALLITNFITYWQLCLIANVLITPGPLIVLMAVDMVVSAVCAYCFSLVYHHLYVPKNMVMIYGNESAIALKIKMDNRYDKYHITKLIPATAKREYIFANLSNYDAVIISDVVAELRNDILKYCYAHQIRTYVAPKISDIILGGATDITLFDTPLLLVRGRGLSASQRFVKRTFDLVLCAIAFVLALPVMVCIAVAIKLEDGGPIFFKQKRATINGSEFEMLKFRSMIPDAEKNGEVIPAVENDPRITKVGKFIRQCRLDELPQLINILKGEMSIVGPRPERLEHIKMYSDEIPEFAFRLKIKGGLTGYAQIYGKYNTSPYDKLRLDLMYIEKYSLLLDLKLILMTIRILLKRESTAGFDEQAALQAQVASILAQMENVEEFEEELIAAGK